MPRWTLEQLDAINKEGNNILVNAGAGSGKTAVLSERVLRKLKSGVGIDNLLILTFNCFVLLDTLIIPLSLIYLFTSPAIIGTA